MNGHAISVAALPAILSRRKWLILLSGLLAAALAMGVTKFIPHGYVGQGALVIDTPQTGPMGGSGGSSEGVLLTQQEILHTQEDVIHSRGLIEQVVSSLNLGKATGLAPGADVPSWLASYQTTMLSWVHYLTDMINGGAGREDTSDADTEAAVQYLLKHLRLDRTRAEQCSVVAVHRRNAGSRSVRAECDYEHLYLGPRKGEASGMG